MNPMKLSVITVAWNSDQFIAEQLSSVFLACQGIKFEQIVVDNGSQDQTVATIQNNFPQVKLIINKKNMGFAAANNQALDRAKGEYLLFLNPDTHLTANNLKKMLDWMDDHANIGIAGCKLLDQNGRYNYLAGPRRFPKAWEMILLILKIHHLFPRVMRGYLMRSMSPDKIQIVDSVRGAFMLVRSDICKRLGRAFDPRYFLWFEDVDLCREARILGYEVVYYPEISARDYVGRSFAKRKNLWKQKIFTASMIKYFKKWDPWYKWVLLSVFRPVGLALSLIKRDK